MRPVMTEREARAQHTFRTLLWSFSRPGQAQRLEARPGDVTGLVSVAESLLDLETGFFCDDPVLTNEMCRLGARRVEVGQADYIFLLEPKLSLLEQAKIGSMQYPDTAATLVMACNFDSGVTLNMSGPGVRHVRELRLQNVPPEFWNLRQRKLHYPLGWDVLLVARTGNGLEVIGIPRSTTVSFTPRGAR